MFRSSRTRFDESFRFYRDVMGFEVTWGEEALDLERTYAAPVEQVWAAWTQNAALATWLSAKANVSTEIGGPYELFWEPDHPDRNSTLGCHVTAVQPNVRLAFSWKGPVPYADLMNVEPLPTSVTVTFESRCDNGTRVTLQHLGWGSSQRWQEAKAWQEKAWQVALDELAKYLAPAEPQGSLVTTTHTILYVKDPGGRGKTCQMQTTRPATLPDLSHCDTSVLFPAGHSRGQLSRNRVLGGLSEDVQHPLL